MVRVMKNQIRVLVLLSFVLPASAVAQTPGAGKTASANPISQAIRGDWNGAKRNVQRSATTMPEAKFGFKPVDTVRTYGQILAHIAGSSYNFCSAARGEKSPYTEDAFEKSATTPTAIINALNDAIAYCDAAYTALDDQKAAEMIDGAFDSGKVPRAAMLTGNTGHLMEHYGNLVTYLRINGLVPPSSQPR